MELFNKNFDKTLKDADTLFRSHSREKDDSWKVIDIADLEKGLFKDIDEFENARTNEDKYHELLDIINWALMLATRIKQESK